MTKYLPDGYETRIFHVEHIERFWQKAAAAALGGLLAGEYMDIDEAAEKAADQADRLVGQWRQRFESE
jgi:hypothetical protein